MAFIDEHRGEYGVEPICEVMPIAPSTYFEHRRRQLRPETRPARAKRDDELRPLIRKAWEESYGVFGVRKVWEELRKDNEVALCTIARLMREEGLEGAVRGRAFKRTKVARAKTDCPPDLVNRQFKANAPNQLCVAELTYVASRLGLVRLRGLHHRRLLTPDRRLEGLHQGPVRQTV